MSTWPDYNALNVVIGFIVPLILAPAMLRRWDCGRRLADAIEAAHVPAKVVADALGLTETELSRQIAGRGPGHLSFDRLTNLPRLVAIHLWLGWGEELGVVDPAAIRAEREAQQVAQRVLYDNGEVRHAA